MRTHGHWRPVLYAAVAVVFGAGPAGAAETATSELVDPSTLRVCADPRNLPFSNQEGEGFENAIAGLVAEELGIPVDYTYYPNTMGFIRNTLRAGRCDLVMGVTSANELVQNTNPYYRSTYALVYPSDSGLDVDSLEDPALAELSIGAVAQTPPVTVLAQQGLLKRMKPYNLMVDTRHYSPGRDLVTDVAAGTTDVGVVWGPIAGYWAKRQDVPMTVVPLLEEPGGVQLSFRISMGVRHADQDWKRRLNDLIAARQADIDAILLDYDVPLLDRQGRLVEGAVAGAGEAVPEPDGYRTSDYRAPTPEGLAGATTVGTGEVEELMRGADVVLIDVLPADQGEDGAEERSNIPGSVWLPNVGYGELSPELETSFEDKLAELTGDDADGALVFYGEADSWMSWNAAKRALAFGYERVYWYPEGTDGWEAAGQLLVAAEPEPMPEPDSPASGDSSG